jgi:hypothetical protein
VDEGETTGGSTRAARRQRRESNASERPITREGGAGPLPPADGDYDSVVSGLNGWLAWLGESRGARVQRGSREACFLWLVYRVWASLMARSPLVVVVAAVAPTRPMADEPATPAGAAEATAPPATPPPLWTTHRRAQGGSWCRPAWRTMALGGSRLLGGRGGMRGPSKTGTLWATLRPCLAETPATPRTGSAAGTPIAHCPTDTRELGG